MDYFLRPKPAYYVIKRELAEIALGIERVVTKTKTHEWTRNSIITKQTTFKIWGINSRLQDQGGLQLLLKVWDIPSGKPIILENTSPRSVTLKPNQSTELYEFCIPSGGDNLVIEAQLVFDGKIIARHANWPEPIKYADVSAEPGISIKSEGEKLLVTAKKPVKGLWFSIEDDEVMFEDNFIDLMPGEMREIHVHGLNGREIQARWYH